MPNLYNFMVYMVQKNKGSSIHSLHNSSRIGVIGTMLTLDPSKMFTNVNFFSQAIKYLMYQDNLLPEVFIKIENILTSLIIFAIGCWLKEIEIV